jgi:outer membrane protein TolC
VSVPVFEGGRRSSRIAEQSAIERELEVRERDLRSQVTVEVRGALLDIASAREQVEAAREQVRFAQQEVSQARERFARVRSISINEQVTEQFLIFARLKSF